MIRNVIFDLDGTLLDTREGVLESAAFAARQMGYPELSRQTMLSFVGPPIQESFMRHYGCDPETAQRAAEIFRQDYSTQTLLLAEPYPGIYDLCEALRAEGIRMAVATYKREDYALTLLRHFGFDRYCDPMHGADNRNILRKEDIIRLCLREMDAAPEESVLIGDTENDARGALRAGVPFLAVTYGFGFKSEESLAEYPHIGAAAAPMEIEPLLRQMDQGREHR